jgi:hypothetical protein
MKEIVTICVIENEKSSCMIPKEELVVFGNGDVYRGQKFVANLDKEDMKAMTVGELKKFVDGNKDG